MKDILIIKLRKFVVKINLKLYEKKIEERYHKDILTKLDQIGIDFSEESLLKRKFPEVKYVNIGHIEKSNYYPFKLKYYGQLLEQEDNNIKIRYFDLETEGHHWSDYHILFKPVFLIQKYQNLKK